MRKNKISFILIIFLAILLFSISATCNFCGLEINTPETDTASQAKLEPTEQTHGDNQLHQDNSSSDEQDQQNINDQQDQQDQQNNDEANDDGNQQDNQQQADGEEDSDEDFPMADEIESISVTKHIYIFQQGTGYLIDGDPSFYYMEGFLVGEKDGKLCQGFITMDISELMGKKLIEAPFNFRAVPIGNPGIFEQVHFALYFWGDRPPGPADFNAPSDIVASYPSAVSGEQTFSNQIFLNKLQETIDAGINKFQLKVFVSGSPNGDGVDDHIFFDEQGFKIEAVYDYLESG